MTNEIFKHVMEIFAKQFVNKEPFAEKLRDFYLDNYLL